ncbi:MAG: response regulator transcription factor [Trichlorobacter sp.]|uniref:response regulator transcription factor n=1 Tax=Trichlorobacter sp. TaxID=2911007 RepID=UPI002564FB6C|nr:response regulator transcription factor [Trichlorobacter sp.]MDK9716449.1 response regulator transcription factor [Trichlorobacter sp.]
MDAGFKILIVEDDQDLRESIVEYLSIAGFDVTAVKSAAEFYQAVAQGGWSVVVVDIGLPDQSGFVLVEYVRANTDMKVIIMTARDALDDRVKGYDAGADLYLVKPVDCRELAAAITSQAQRHISRSLFCAPVSHSLSPPTEHWELAQSSWSLIAPDGAQIQLTGKELHFIELLSSGVGKTIARETLLLKLYQRYDEYTSRSLDSLVRRLRVKIMSATACVVPIKTVHAVGYCFSATLRSV